MKKNFSCLTIVLLVFSIGLWHNDAQAGLAFLQPDGVIIDQDAVLLEVVGGNLFGDTVPGSDTNRTTHDSWIYLAQGDTTNLHVALIDQKTLDTQFSSFPIPPFAFAFADRMVNTADGDLVTCFVTNGGAGGGELTLASSPDGLNFTTAPISGAPDYDSCAIVINDNNHHSNNLAIGAHNNSADTFEIFESNDGGLNWAMVDNVPNVCGPFDGCVIPNMTRNNSGGYNVLCSRPTGANDQDVVLLNTQTNDIHEVIPTHPRTPAILQESCAANQGNNNFFTFYNSESNTVAGIVEDDGFGMGLGDLVLFFKDAPDFNGPGEQGFFGIGCNRFPQGPSNPESFQFGTTTPGGRIVNIRTDADGLVIVENDLSFARVVPTRNTQSGPVGTTLINNDITDTSLFPEGIESGNSIAYSQSFDYAQGIFTGPASIPTLSEWGLIAMASILGLVGFMIIRRRKVTA